MLKIQTKMYLLEPYIWAQQVGALLALKDTSVSCPCSDVLINSFQMWKTRPSSGYSWSRNDTNCKI